MLRRSLKCLIFGASTWNAWRTFPRVIRNIYCVAARKVLTNSANTSPCNLSYICASACNQEITANWNFFFKGALGFPLANCVSPCCLICDRLLETDRTLPGLWIPFPRTLTSGLSGRWSLCEMANGARDIIQQIPGLQSKSPSPLVVPAGKEPQKTPNTLAFLTAAPCLPGWHRVALK